MPEYLRESLKTGHIICSLEGNAEKAVIDTLYNSNELVFQNRDTHNGENHINILRVLVYIMIILIKATLNLVYIVKLNLILKI